MSLVSKLLQWCSQEVVITAIRVRNENDFTVDFEDQALRICDELERV